MGSGSGVPLSLSGGKSLEENLNTLKKTFRLNKNGYFGTKGKGRSNTRNISSKNPSRTAWDFAHIAAYSPMGTTTIAGKGTIWTMKDGGIVSYRYYSSSNDRSPVVELKVRNIPGVRSQKIHFTKGSQSHGDN